MTDGTDAARTPPFDYRFGRFVLQPAARRLLRDGEPVGCPRLVFDLLHYLIAQRDRAIGRDELATAVWRRADVADVQIGQVVLRARRAVDDDGTAQHSIATVPGFGYHWVAPTQAVHAVEAPGVAGDGAEAVAMVDPAAFDAAHPAPPSAPDPQPIAVDVPPSSDATENAVVSTHGRRTRGLWIAIAALLVSLGVALWHWRAPATSAPNDKPIATPPAAAATQPRAVLLPLRVQGRAEHAWLRLGGMDLIAERLRAAGIAVPASESVLAALRLADDTPDAQHAALRAAFGDVAAIDGEAVVDANGEWTLRLVARSENGLPITGSASQSDPVAAAIAAGDALAAALGGTPSGDPSSALDAGADWRRARAALLANEVDVARRILAASRHLAARPAERAVRLAQVDVREGKLSDADVALSAVLAELPPGKDDALRAQALIVRGSTRTRLGDFDAAWRDFDAALAALPDDAPALERARALSGRGASAVPSGRADAALADMGRARSLFAAVGDTFGTARVDANLGMLELYRARPATALEHLDAAAAGLHAFGAAHEWQVVQTAQVEAHLALLQHAAAQAIAERAWAQREHSRDPDQRSDIALNRAQVLLATGRYREAGALLGDAQLDAVQGAVLRVRVASLRADLALRESRWQDAANGAQAALAAWPMQGAERERERLVRIELRARLALGDSAAARRLAERPPSPFALPDDVAYRELSRADWLLAQRDDGALDALRAALAAAGEGGVPATLAAVADTAVPVLLQRGLTDEAGALAGRVAPWAGRDFDCALAQVRVHHAAGAIDAWRAALAVARALAGERSVPDALTEPPTAR